MFHKRHSSDTAPQPGFWPTLRLLALILLALTAFAAAPFAFFFTLPLPIGAVAIAPDGTSDGGATHLTKVVPWTTTTIERLPVVPSRVMMIGGENQQLLNGELLTPQNSFELRATLTTSKPLPHSVQGSDITLSLLGLASWLNQRPEKGRKPLCYIGDAVDDVRKEIPKFRPGIAEGVDVYLFFPRNSNPLAAQALKAAGAKSVTIVMNQTEAQAAVDEIITGTTSHRQMLRWTALAGYELLLILALVWLNRDFIRDVRERRHQSREKEAQQRVRQHQFESALLAPPQPPETPPFVRPQAKFKASLADEGQEVIHALRAGGDDVFRITGENSTVSDFVIDNRLLGLLLNVRADVTADDAHTLRIRNSGEHPIIVGNQSVSPGGSRTIPLDGGSLMIGPHATILFSKVTSNAAANNHANGHANGVSSDAMFNAADLLGGRR